MKQPDIIFKLIDCDLNELATFKVLIGSKYKWKDNGKYIWLTKKEENDGE
jgi:hypothetical protein